MPMPVWAAEYIGLPFRDRGRDRLGLDCWGLVRLVLAEKFGADVPSYADNYELATDHQTLGALIGREALAWIPIARGKEVLGDVIVLRVMGQPMHVGLVLDDGWMLHIEKGIDAAIDKYRGMRWERRISGFYRYAGAGQSPGLPDGLSRPV